MTQQKRTTLKDAMETTFGTADLKALCFDLEGVDFENLSGSNKTTKIISLIQFMERRSRFDELYQLVKEMRPNYAWPQVTTQPDNSPQTGLDGTSITLSRDDFRYLQRQLMGLDDWKTTRGRIDFVSDLLAGSPRKDDIMGQIDFDGAPRGAATRLIEKLITFGWDEPGQETLGLLINALRDYVGVEDGAQLRAFFDRYPLNIEPTAKRYLDSDDWRQPVSAAEVQEKVFGENTLRDVRWLHQGYQAARAVVKIICGGTSGSGFLCGPNLVMTNNHVIGSANQAVGSEFVFFHELEPSGQTAQAVTMRAKVDGHFYTNPDLDFTIVELAELPAEVEPLNLLAAPVRRDERVNIIQHPGGRYKKISIQNNFVAFGNRTVIQYLTATEPGSSGSPVLNDHFEVVGIHHSGGDLLEPDTLRKFQRNAGTTMMAVAEDVQRNMPDLYGQLNF